MNYKIEDDKLVCYFPSRLNTPECLAIEKELNQKMQETEGAIVFDMEGVAFVCSMFLRLCLQTFKTKTKEKFSMRNLSPEVKKVFMIAGFGDMLL